MEMNTKGARVWAERGKVTRSPSHNSSHWHISLPVSQRYWNLDIRRFFPTNQPGLCILKVQGKSETQSLGKFQSTHCKNETKPKRENLCLIFFAIRSPANEAVVPAAPSTARSSPISKLLIFIFGGNAYWVPTSPEAFTGAKPEKNADSLLVEN